MAWAVGNMFRWSSTNKRNVARIEAGQATCATTFDGAHSGDGHSSDLEGSEIVRGLHKVAQAGHEDGNRQTFTATSSIGNVRGKRRNFASAIGAVAVLIIVG